MIKPNPKDFPEFYRRYINEVIDKNIISYLSEQKTIAVSFFNSIGEEKSKYRYKENKWSIKEILGHVCDAERLFTARALHFARNEKQALPGFDEDEYVSQANFDKILLKQLVEDFSVMRDSNISLFNTFDAEIFERKGTANNTEYTVASILYIITGHLDHHIKIIKKRYL